MTRLQELSDEQKVVATVLLDRSRGFPVIGKSSEGPGTVAEIAAWTNWPGARKYGLTRVARILRELHAEGIAKRAGRGPEGVRWTLDAAGYIAASRE